MKRARIIHNPKAGNEEHSRQELIGLITSQGYECEYFTVKDAGWQVLDHKTDFLIICGGDGTVRKVIKKLLTRRLWEKKYPLALLPRGTANNLARTLGIDSSDKPKIDSWKKHSLKKFSIGLLYGMEEIDFFLEAFGYGVFPELIGQMKAVDSSLIDRPEKSIDTSLATLKKVVENFQADTFTIEADEEMYSGKYLLVEVMNSSSIGPNLDLSPNADTSDGFFELVLVPESDREKLINYVAAKRKGEAFSPDFKLVKCRNLKITGTSRSFHIDDKLIESGNAKEMQVQLQNGIFEFLV